MFDYQGKLKTAELERAIRARRVDRLRHLDAIGGARGSRRRSIAVIRRRLRSVRRRLRHPFAARRGVVVIR